MMTYKRTLITAAGLAFAVAPTLAFPPALGTSADYDPKSPVRPSAGYLNDYLRQDDAGMAAWDLGVATRLRYEVRDNFGISGRPGSLDFRENGADVDNNYLLYRIRPRVGYNSEWFNVLVEGRHSGAESDDRDHPGVSPESDEFDLHQAYVMIGNHKEFPISVKLGRQELNYGDERVIGGFAWNNIGRTFDAAKVRWQNPWFGVDFFTSRPVVPDNHNFNMSNDYEYFSGAYFNTKKIPKQTTEFYFLARNASAKAPAYDVGVLQLPASARDIYSVGLRVKSNPGELNGWDYTAEVVGQLGHYNDPAMPAALDRSLEHQAYMIAANGGYTFTDVAYTPRIGLEYALASGDSDPLDGKHETYDQLYPTKHKFFGFMDFFAMQNMHDIRLSASAKPLPRLNLLAEYHAFFLADTSDNLYAAPGGRRGGIAPTPGTGYGINPDYDSYVGSEIDFVATYNINPQTILEFGYSHFFVGEYIEQSLRDPAFGSTDANWFYVSLNINF
jgi:hypothetical protein